jgi:hypothetical protein
MFLKRPQGPDPAPDTEPAPVLTPTQRVRQKEAELRMRELEELAAFEARKRAAEREDWERQRAEKEKAEKGTRSRVAWSKVAATAVPYLPLVLTNIMAVMGQTGWGRENLDQIGAGPDSPARWVIALLFAGTLESLALFQGYYANKALERGDSAAGLYLGAFGTAAVVAGLNYSHYADDANPATVGPLEVGGPTAMAVVFAMFSFISPALWRIHSRAVNRNKLKERGEIDTRAPRLAWAKKIWHPIRTTRAMYWASWEKDVRTPADVLDLYEAKMAERRERKAAKARAKVASKDKAQEPGPARHRVPELESVPAPAGEGDVPSVVRRFPDAWDALVASWRADNTLSQRALAETYLKGNRHHARAMLTYLDTWKEVAA